MFVACFTRPLAPEDRMVQHTFAFPPACQPCLIREGFRETRHARVQSNKKGSHLAHDRADLRARDAAAADIYACEDAPYLFTLQVAIAIHVSL